MKPKGRPKKTRLIAKAPKVVQFSPRGKPGRPDEVEISLEHYEAIRLADCQGLEQAEGARELGVSRATFGRILREARKRVGEALAYGKIIRIVENLAAEKVQSEV